MKIVSSLLLRKERPKVLVTRAAKTKSRGKKQGPLPEGEVEPPKKKKTRAKKKATAPSSAECAVVKPKRTRATKKPPLPKPSIETTVEGLADIVLRLSIEDGGRTTRNTVNTLASTTGMNNTIPVQQKTGGRRGRPRKKAVVRATLADVAVSIGTSTANSTEKPETRPGLHIDLNLPADDAQPVEVPLTEIESKVLRWQASSAIKLTAKPKIVVCKRRSVSKRTHVTLPPAFLELDLNGPPLDYGNQDLPAVLRDGVVLHCSLAECIPPVETIRTEHNAPMESTEADSSRRIVRQPPDQQHTDGQPRPAMPIKPRDSKKQWGAGVKRGCLASFIVKSLYLLPLVTEITIYESDHVNEARK